VLEARIVSRAELVTAGLAVLPEAIRLLASNVELKEVIADGTKVPKGTSLCVFKGPSHEMLRLERPVLNLIGRLSGIATRTRVFHEAMVAAAVGAIPVRRIFAPVLEIVHPFQAPLATITDLHHAGGWVPREAAGYAQDNARIARARKVCSALRRRILPPTWAA